MSDLAVSRRAVTRALATLPAIAIPVLSGATSRAAQPGDTPMNMLTMIKAEANAFEPRSRDAEFWQAYDAYAALRDEFEATTSEDDEVWDDYGARVDGLMLALIDLPVSTFSAFITKQRAVGDTGWRVWRHGITIDERLGWDAERIMKLEIFGEAATAVFLR